MVRVSDIIKILEEWAPPSIAWEKDNVGLQIGSSEETVKSVLITLDVTKEVIEEARRSNCNLIITHHPLLFHPVKTLTPETLEGALSLEIARNGINLYATHTNIDFASGGVSFTLAEKLGLENIDFLRSESGSLKKIAVFVPPDHIGNLTNAMTSAGAGIIGDYDSCSFQVSGKGTFRPLEGATPYVGKVGNLESVDEIRIEMVVPTWKVTEVVNAMIAAHPYEEVAYDVYPTETVNPNYGAGAIGSLPSPLSEKDFIDRIRQSLQLPFVRWTSGENNFIEKVAVCGGSGSDLLPVAIKHSADAFVTADIRYHTFGSAKSKILLIDGGHYETEIFIVDALSHKLQKIFPDISIMKTKINTNPILYS